MLPKQNSCLGACFFVKVYRLFCILQKVDEISNPAKLTLNQARKYTDKSIVEKIRYIKQSRIDKENYFVGSQYVQMEFSKKYSENEVPKLWYIDKVARDAKLQTKS